MEDRMDRQGNRKSKAKCNRIYLLGDHKGAKAPVVKFRRGATRRYIAIKKPDSVADSKRVRTAMPVQTLIQSPNLKL